MSEGEQAGPKRHIIAVTDSDSYLKWGVSVLDQLPSAWSTEIILLRNRALPSETQVNAALAHSSLAGIELSPLRVESAIRRIQERTPDVLLVATRGAMADVLTTHLDLEDPKRPVIVTGLPGVSIPATARALEYRSCADVFVLHSKREVDDFQALASKLDLGMQFGLASLPFMTNPAEQSGVERNRVIFAAQAIVPAELDERRRLVRILSEAARKNPGTDIVVKLRARRGEKQTHAEKESFEDLIDEAKTKDPEGFPSNLVVEDGPMSEHLKTAIGLVSISSTAIIESIAASVPVLALADFGVEESLLNTVFVDSHLLGDSAALGKLSFHQPNANWLDRNYFHATADNNWLSLLESLAETRATMGLPKREVLMDRPEFTRARRSAFARTFGANHKHARKPSVRRSVRRLAVSIKRRARGALLNRAPELAIFFAR